MTDLKSDYKGISLHKKVIGNHENSFQDNKYSQLINKGKIYKFEKSDVSTPKKINLSLKNKSKILPALNQTFFKNLTIKNQLKPFEKDTEMKSEIDSVFDKKLKGIIDETIKLQESQAEQKNSDDEKEVLNLNFWEIDHLNEDASGNSDSNISNISSFSKKSDLEGLNFQASDHNKRKRKANKGKQTIKTISDQRDEELGLFLLQNINISKSKFNFDIFLPSVDKSISDEKKPDMYDLSISKKLETLKKSTHYLGFNENVIKKLDFHLKGDIETFSKSEHYRDIIRSKQSKENEYREELFRIGHKLIEKKNEKRKLINDISISATKFQKFQSITQSNIDHLDSIKHNLNILFANIVSNNNIDILHRMPNISREFYTSVSNCYSYEGRRYIVKERIESIEKDLEQLHQRMNSEKSKTQINILEAKKQLKMIDKEKKILKVRFKDLCKDQRLYYLDILKKGVDVRDEGLVWVVRRLIELNSRLDYTTFPRFLENNQIDYLLLLAQKQIKSNQKKIMLKTLKEKQKRLREEENGEKFMGISKNTFNLNKTNKSNFFFNSNQTCKSFNKTILSNKTMIEFNKIFTKYDKMIKKTFEKKMEDIQIQGVIDSMKDRMKIKNIDNENLKETSIEKYFNDNKKQKEYFEEILILRNEIEALEKEYQQLKEDQLVLIKQKYETGNVQKIKNNVQYDLIYSALFGNNICF